MLGKLYLIPTDLGGENFDLIITPFVKRIINEIDHYVVEKEKHARRYLRKLEIDKAIDELTLYPLNKHTESHEISDYLKAAEQGLNIGLISEAGCPGVADPGAEIVAMAHQKNIQVVPLTGPSSILLALMGSGFNGQEFSFHGYLPREQQDRIKKIKTLESMINATGSSHIFMDTPYRNNHVLADLLKQCNENTELCIAVDLTINTEMIKTQSILQWKRQKIDLNKRPCMFILGKSVVR